MHLITPLISGINGGENGTALLFKRGTALAATWYSDYDGTGANATGDPITLDANGSAEVYVDENVQVVVIDSDVIEIRRWDDMTGATAVELKSTAFTGVDYTTAANALSNPNPLPVVMDRWLTKSGAPDWDISVNGDVDTIPNTIAPALGMFLNVKGPPYNAVGDGIVDDSGAITAAISAATASGGILFFPPGTYQCDSNITVPGQVSMMGCGPSSKLVFAANRSMTLAEDSLLSGWTVGSRQSITRMAIDGGNSNETIEFSSGAVATLNGVVMSGFNVDQTLLRIESDSDVRVLDSLLITYGDYAIRVDHADGKLSVQSSRFVMMGGLGTNMIYCINCESMSILGCDFDMEGAPAGANTIIRITGVVADGQVSISNCFFRNCSGLSSARAISTFGLLDGASFVESGNVFDSNINGYSISSVSNNSKRVRLESRGVRGVRIQDDSGSLALPCVQFGKVFFEIVSSAGGGVIIASESPIPLYHSVVVYLVNRGVGSYLFDFAFNMLYAAGSITVAAGSMVAITFASKEDSTGEVKWYEVGGSVQVDP